MLPIICTVISAIFVGFSLGCWLRISTVQKQQEAIRILRRNYEQLDSAYDKILEANETLRDAAEIANRTVDMLRRQLDEERGR